MPDSAQHLQTAALQAEQAKTLAAPRRRYGVLARALFLAMDLLYGRTRTLSKFRVLEIVARVPYQAWEQVAYVAMTHTHRKPGFARRVFDFVQESRHQQDNEQWHLLILQELLEARGVREGWLRHRLVPQLLALAYYHVSWLLYVVQPRLSYRLNADFEDHAEHEYMRFVAQHPELESAPFESQFSADYGTFTSLADLFRQIGLDERHHKQLSEQRMTQPRFGARTASGFGSA
jgi:ubiquinol oxidase